MSNKYQEALDRFKIVAQNDWVNNYQKCKDEEKTIHIGNYRMFEIDGEAIKTLQELVDKETLMKVKILGHDEDWLTGLKISYGECPKCKFHVCDDEFYCRNCGQRVYFEESEE